VVTRYFGGIKLGAGGLVRAYGRAVAEAVDAIGTVRRAPHTVVEVTIDHADAGRLDNELRAAGHRIAGSSYGARVSLTVHVPTPDAAVFAQWPAARTAGRAVLRIGDQLFLDVLDQPLSDAGAGAQMSAVTQG